MYSHCLESKIKVSAGPHPLKGSEGGPSFLLPASGGLQQSLVFLLFWYFWQHHMACGILTCGPGIEPPALSSESTESQPLDRQGVPPLVSLGLCLCICIFFPEEQGSHRSRAHPNPG